MAVDSTSETMWVERITIRWPRISESRLRNRTRSSGSRPAVGSSTISKLGIVEQRLRDSDPLPHAAREAAEGPLAHVGQIDQLEQLVDAPPRRGASSPFTAAMYSRNSTAVRFG